MELNKLHSRAASVAGSTCTFHRHEQLPACQHISLSLLTWGYPACEPGRCWPWWLAAAEPRPPRPPVLLRPRRGASLSSSLSLYSELLRGGQSARQVREPVKQAARWATKTWLHEGQQPAQSPRAQAAARHAGLHLSSSSSSSSLLLEAGCASSAAPAQNTFLLRLEPSGSVPCAACSDAENSRGGQLVGQQGNEECLA